MTDAGMKTAEELTDIEWLHRFINCVPFGADAPRSDIDRAHAIVATLAAVREDEVDEFNAGFDAATNCELEEEPPGMIHDQWRVGYAWAMHDKLKAENKRLLFALQVIEMASNAALEEEKP